MKFIDGGVTAPQGFLAAGVHAGIRKNKSKKDLALIVSEKRAAAAAVYTQNKVKGAPLYVTKQNLSDGYAQAVICNSGNANTCVKGGVEVATRTAEIVEKVAKIAKNDVIVASTGVIGLPLDITPIEGAIPSLVAALSTNDDDAAEAIMTTDTVTKKAAVEFVVSGKRAVIGGIAKGSGMIHPNMATMLVFLTTDAAISPKMLGKAISDDVKSSFNMVSVDGDTSTNDMLTILANGLAGNDEITVDGEDYREFTKALNMVTVKLCRMIAADGEGATKLIECVVSGAERAEQASAAAKSVITSSLFKAAMFGADANWGRVLCALGYSGEIDPDKIDVAFKSAAGEIAVCKGGEGLDFSEEYAKKVLLEKEIQVLINLNCGTHSATAWGCDLTYDYVKINGDYRT